VELAFAMSKPLKGILRAAAIAAAVLLTLELISSYVLFRYYSSAGKTFSPVGSATQFLLDRAVLRAHGEHQHMKLSSEHGPLFATDEVLGYRLLPGEYRIDEKIDGLRHSFHLKVNDLGHRVTSYVPQQSKLRLLITGDSSVFGLGVDDEMTAPWLLQTRLAEYEVVNLTATGYSTVQALLQLRQIVPAVGKDDIVLLVYRAPTSVFNVADSGMMKGLKTGLEVQLGDPSSMRRMNIPYGAIDGGGRLVIRRMSLSCQFGERVPNCTRPDPGEAEAVQVTQRTFDEVMALHAGRVGVVIVSGVDSDPVIRYLKSIGIAILDVRGKSDDPEASDSIPTDGHMGPFWHHELYVRLLAALQREHMIE
jgi:hypothetical protein